MCLQLNQGVGRTEAATADSAQARIWSARIAGPFCSTWRARRYCSRMSTERWRFTYRRVPPPNMPVLRNSGTLGSSHAPEEIMPLKLEQLIGKGAYAAVFSPDGMRPYTLFRQIAT